jgi:uncharacterized protein (DUF1697 family)
MKYVALIRGINVGGNNIVSMSKLKGTFELLGYTNVVTYINSGNVVFETNTGDEGKIAKSVEKEIEKDFGFSVNVLVRDAQNIKDICNKIPKTWKNDADEKTDVMFLWQDLHNPKILTDLGFNKAIENAIYVGGAVVWNIERKNYSKSKIPKLIGTKTYKLMTVRNVNTVRKLEAMMTVEELRK